MPDEAATRRLGQALAAGAANGLVLYLKGELGSGKTTLARGLIQGLGHPGRVKSPTYTLLEPYSLLRLNLYHFDFYRFKDQSEWLSSGFREHFNPASICIVEWPERAGDLLAPPDLEIQLQYDAQARSATLAPHSGPGTVWSAGALSRWRLS